MRRIVLIRWAASRIRTRSAEWFNTAAFANPAVGGWGNAGHNSLRGPGRDNWNLSLFKSFVLNEARGSRFELRAESFNTWNHTEFNQVSNGSGLEQLRPGDFCLRSESLSVRSETLLLIECLMCSRPARAR